MKLLAVLFLVVSLGVPARANPFTPGSTPSVPVIAAPPILGGRLMPWLAGVQRDLNERLATLSRQAKENPTALPVLMAFATAFLFGLVHAVGPGHGKTFTLSYFLAAKPKVGRGILFGGLISILDSITSVVIVAAAYLFFRVALPGQATERVSGVLQVASYVLIVGIGVWHFVAHLRHDHHHHDGEAQESARDRRMFPLALSIGLVPCPIAIVILVFGLSIGAFGFGAVLTLFLSLGQAVALALVALAAMALRSSALAVAGAAAHSKVTRVLELGGSALIVVFGVVLLLTVL